MPQIFSFHSSCLLLFSLSIACVTGCGGGGSQLKTAPAYGTITLDGKPLSQATITLFDETGKNNPSAAISDNDGKFKLAAGATDGAMPGKYKVTIKHFVDKDGKSFPLAEGMDATQMEMQGLAKADLPATYSDFNQTVLSADIEAGKSNDLTFALKADGSKP